MGRKVSISLPDLLPMQEIVSRDESRFRVCCCGRRFGKTCLAVVEAVACALQGGKVWWVAPTFPLAMIGWRGMSRMVMGIKGVRIVVNERMIQFPGGGWVQLKSADNPVSLRGEGLDLLVIDEAAFVKEDAWIESLRPTLSDRRGRALIISTPSGRNWFWRAFQRGQDPEYPDWQSWQLTTYDNPTIPAEEIDEARATMPEPAFLQEYMAEFVDRTGAVFRNVRECAMSHPLSGPEPGGIYVAGLDLARKVDYTVITVFDSSAWPPRMVYIDRFTKQSWHQQIKRVTHVIEKFGVSGLVVDQTGVGDPIYETLSRDLYGFPVVGFTMTQRSKAHLVEEMVMAFERMEISILNDATLISELEAYEGVSSSTGLVKYRAPAGMNDDCVMATGLGFAAAAGVRAKIASQMALSSAQELLEPVHISSF